MLNFIETKTKTQPKQLVIFLHGYGSNKQDLMSLSTEFTSVLPDAHFISVEAPFECEAGYGHQWFSLSDRSESIMFDKLQPAAQILDKFIDGQLNRFSLDENNLILIGFSQGTMMALHVAPRRLKSCIVIGFSGMLVKGEKLELEAKSKPKILLIHGENDEVIPAFAFSKSVEYLKAANFPLEHYLLKNLAHNINQKALEISQEFLSI